MRTRDADKEKLVIAKAITLIVQDGLQGFSMNKLAKACNISVATLYIYYQDKEDLIKKIGVEIGQNFFSNTIKGFTPEMTFEQGLWKQWENRSSFALHYPDEVACFEVIRHSPYGEYIMQTAQLSEFKDIMTQFFENAVRNKQMIPLPLEVFWSVAYGPLYSLLRFHSEGKSLGEKPFTFSRKIMEETFQVVIKAFKP